MCWSIFRRSVHIGLTVVFVFFIQACGFREPLPKYSYERNCYAVEVADGPEDFVLDTWTTSPRLLVSSHERRGWAQSGGIYYFDLKTGYSSPMPRRGEPKNLVSFRPHGMDVRSHNGETTLYVILHDPYNHGAREENAIAVYRVMKDGLQFLELLESSPHLWSPNDLSVLDNGDIYVTNDYRWEVDVYIRRETSEVVFFKRDTRTWKVAAAEISFANGILAKPDRVYLSATRGDFIAEYPRRPDGSLGVGKKIVDIKGPDNIMPLGDYLIVTAHYNDWAFMNHSKDPEEIAPSVVFMINPYDPDPSNTKKALYVDEGNQISAASTALVFGRKLFISQVFNSKIVICDAGDLETFGNRP